MARENIVKNKVREILKKRKFFYVANAPSIYGYHSNPDFTVCWHGHFVGLECKSSVGRPTSTQLIRGEQILSSEGLWFIIDPDNVHNFETIIDELLCRK